MKTNGNDTRIKDYYIGLDVGTSSVGWAVSDLSYNIPKFKGNAMWGIRLFDEAKDASGRRGVRTARRRLNRRKQRLALLELIFNDEIAKIDPCFFIRLKESSLYEDDRAAGTGKYSLFNDPDYTDKDYLKQYPTIYHLRKDLIHSAAPHDIRLVYLAVHHILKSRGHFLFDGDVSSAGGDLSNAIKAFKEYVGAEYDADFNINDIAGFESTLLDTEIGVTAKKSRLRSYVESASQEEPSVDIKIIADALAGATVRLSALYCDDELANADIKSICLKNDLDEQFDELSEILGERVDLLLQMKMVYDSARLAQIKGKFEYISDAKVALYDKNHDDLQVLKKYIRESCDSAVYDKIFKDRKTGNNFVAYSRYKSLSDEKPCKQEDLCTFLEKIVPQPPEDSEYAAVWREIKNKTFYTKLKGTANGVIPNQLQRVELEAILNNAAAYIPFLAETDKDGIRNADKILSIFDFRIPYYIGPLNNKSPKSWVVRTPEKIYPWNFGDIVDVEKSAQAFITNLIGKCTYTGEDVLPADSLLYSKYMLLNELNPLKVNGKSININVKQQIVNDLFIGQSKKVTKKSIKDYLLCKGYINSGDEISGIDDVIKTRLKSRKDFDGILTKYGDADMVENIIQSILIFGDDKKMLRRWIKREYPSLTSKETDYICKLKYKDWGRLSRVFLTEIYSADENGEVRSIMDMLWGTNQNLMQILSSDYQFLDKSVKYRDSKYGSNQSLDDMLEEMYIAPAVRRSVRQTLRIVDELVDIEKAAPKKIFIEVAREHLDDKKRTVSRKQRLLDLYASCRSEAQDLYDSLENVPEEKLRSDKLYLYYTQLGRCMYSGEPIDLEAMLRDNNTYDIDHIFPRSRIKDDSLDNRVLVRSSLNREKTNEYPVSQNIRTKMSGFWEGLKQQGLISEKKLERLKRNYPLTEKELSEFVARQLTETQQSTKALATILKKYYPKTAIVYSKAGNVSDFRQKFDLIKCRDINDLHHAKDAYLNIVVGNVYDTKFTKRFFANIANETYSLNKVFDFDTKDAWKADGTSIATVKKYMARNNIRYTRMPYEAKGQISDLQILSAGSGQLAIKEGRDIKRYGGYNNVYGAYFFVVEHLDKKKRVRTIEPVFIYKKELYEKDPEKYCKEILDLVEPIVIASNVPIDALLELDGMRLNIAGRTGAQILYRHSYQLAISSEEELYMKNVIKYVERCRQAKKDLPITKYDGISQRKNVEIYDLFTEKLNSGVYSKIFNSLKKDVCDCRDVFIKKPIADQCRILTEMLKAFKCDRQNPNFKLLNGKSSVGIVLFNKSVSKLNSAYIVNQSVTGLYEHKTDLLK